MTTEEKLDIALDALVAIENNVITSGEDGWRDACCEKIKFAYDALKKINPEAMTKELEKELFEMVYQWGRVGVVTDELCNAYQDKIKALNDCATQLERKRCAEIARKHRLYLVKPQNVGAIIATAIEKESL